MQQSRASYTRSAGVMHMLAALDLATGRLFTGSGRTSVRTEFLNLLRVLLTHPPLPGARAPVLGQFRASLCWAYSVMRAR
jgi:hypothetical protein